MGYEVHVAVNEQFPIQWADQVFALPFYKSLISPKNILAILRARKLLSSQNYEKICTNTTLAGIIIRMAALHLKIHPRIYHIVHGYLFNLDSGFKKYLYLFFEKIVVCVTDVIMTMNREDFEIAKKYKLYKSGLFYINGMGVDPSRISSPSLQEKNGKKLHLGFSPEDFLFIYAAEFSKRKNQKLVIKAFAKCELKKAHLLLAGDGKKLNECKQFAKQLGQTDKIHFLGYVKDVLSYYMASDAVVSTSHIEGMPFNIIEAIGCSLPVVVSDIKGHRELVGQAINGLLFKDQNERELITCLKKIYAMSSEQRLLFGKAGKQKSTIFLLPNVFEQIMNIYTHQ